MGKNKMKRYDGVNDSFGTTTIKVFFQVDEYKWSMKYTIGRLLILRRIDLDDRE